MPFLLAIFAVLVGSTPNIFVFFLNPSNKVPSLEPISMTKDFLFNLYLEYNFLLNFF